jgi:hypothetical protein
MEIRYSSNTPSLEYYNGKLYRNSVQYKNGNMSCKGKEGWDFKNILHPQRLLKVVTSSIMLCRHLQVSLLMKGCNSLPKEFPFHVKEGSF